MKHFNRLLKDMIIGIGANTSKQATVQSSKSLNEIKTVFENFDKSAGIHTDSVHHSIRNFFLHGSMRRDTSLPCVPGQPAGQLASVK